MTSIIESHNDPYIDNFEICARYDSIVDITKKKINNSDEF